MQRTWSFLLLPWVVVQLLVAQTTGTLAGRVVDVGTAPLPDATVHAVLPDTFYTVATAADGSFRFTALPTGMYKLRTSHVGFRSATLPEVWVRAGRSEWVELVVERTIQELGQVEVRANVPERMDATSSEPLTVERSLRYPATFFDPARLAMSYAGVAATNDEANHFSVRGTSPGANAWLLEGVEIVTPNHLTNAGTQSDQPTMTGGGTTILSAQLLGSSQLLIGGMQAAYGNALGGIMDLHLRNGTSERRAFTAQAGLLGIDLSTEGPFRTGGKASYLINYRYSTLGLLSAAGVDVGEEKITFQDLAFTVNVPFGERSELKVFAMGGNSSNKFDRKDSTEWEVDKDSRDIRYSGAVGIAGAVFKRRMGERSSWTTSIALSEGQQERKQEELLDRGVGLRTYQDMALLRERKLSMNTQWRMVLNARMSLLVGASAVERTVAKELFLVNEQLVGWLLRPYATVRYAVTEELRVEVGAGYAHWSLSGTGIAEPRFNLGWEPTQRDRITLAVGLRSQAPPMQNYTDTRYLFQGMGTWTAGNGVLAPTRSADLELRLAHAIRPHLWIHLAGFVQRLSEVPVADMRLLGIAGAGYSVLNTWDGITRLPLVNGGEGTNVGIEVGAQRSSHRGLFYQVNATFLQARYTDENGVSAPSRWDVGNIANAVLGKEWERQKTEVKRTWGFSGRLNAIGGQRYTASSAPPYPLPAFYGERYNSTYRLDLRIYLKRERTGRTGMWALDLLNATNARNEAYRYFDQRKGEEVTRYQLGLIPNISYRIEF